MSIIKIKPTNNARRGMTVIKREVTNAAREKSLSFGVRRTAGRNNRGVITSGNRGGGFKRVYRVIDFKQTSRLDQNAQVIAIHYDPNRTANIALIEYSDTAEKSYILSAEGMKIGDKLICAESASIRNGNRMKLKNIPASTQIYNVELSPNRGGQIIKSAGSYGILLGSDSAYAQIKLPSGEVRKVSLDCYASIGVVSNVDHNKIVTSKAGRFRLAGNRPHVRGKAKNPVDHPHGGGEGNVSIGLTRPKTPWGMPALGHKTRKRKNPTSKLIVRRRK